MRNVSHTYASLGTYDVIFSIRDTVSDCRDTLLLKVIVTEIENDHQVSFNAGESHIQEQDLRALLRALPKVTQKVFNLFAIDGFKHREISDYLGITEGASKWHVNEARKKLKGMLEKQADLEKKVLKQN